jgi:uncharacterized protein YndB with AHSA1/START domain
MWGTGSVTGVVPKPAEDVFAFVTDVDRLPEWNAIIDEVVERPGVVQRDTEWVVRINIRSRRLRREVPASIDALTLAMEAPVP